MDQREYERITKLEVQLQSMNAAVIQIEEKLDYNQKNYMQRTEIDEMFKFRDREIRDLKQAQEKLESNKKSKYIDVDFRTVIGSPFYYLIF
ncbi:hypothetical protein ACT7C3_11415 [Bacillus pacificus]